MRQVRCCGVLTEAKLLCHELVPGKPEFCCALTGASLRRSTSFTHTLQFGVGKYHNSFRDSLSAVYSAGATTRALMPTEPARKRRRTGSSIDGNMPGRCDPSRDWLRPPIDVDGDDLSSLELALPKEPRWDGYMEADSLLQQSISSAVGIRSFITTPITRQPD